VARHLERAVALRPGYGFRGLEPAQIYLDRGRPKHGGEQLEHWLILPATDVQDAAHTPAAMRLLERLR
jgi:hypothetical protein